VRRQRVHITVGSPIGDVREGPVSAVLSPTNDRLHPTRSSRPGNGIADIRLYSEHRVRRLPLPGKLLCLSRWIRGSSCSVVVTVLLLQSYSAEVLVQMRRLLTPFWCAPPLPQQGSIEERRSMTSLVADRLCTYSAHLLAVIYTRPVCGTRSELNRHTLPSVRGLVTGNTAHDQRSGRPNREESDR